MKSNDEEYKEIFLAEALENFEEINRVLTQLEKKPTDSAHINTLFRITHTMKGNATAMGFEGISSLTHVMEDLFGEVRNKRIELDSEIFTALFKAVDVLEALIGAIKTGQKVQFRGIQTKLKVIIERATAESSDEATSEKAEETKPIEPKESKNKSKKTAPSNAKKKEDSKESEPKETKSKESEPKESAPEPLKVIEEVLNEEEEEQEEVDLPSSDSKIVVSDLVHVPVRKLDNLLNLVGELIIERDRILASYSTSAHSNEFSRLNRISSDLQYSVMDVRLVQVGFLFNKFHRVVRDAANLEGKKVRLELSGVDTEIDRNILQIISDSLIHLIRNSVSHGIESPEEREAHNKTEEGVISLSAFNDSDGVVIEIKDDGKGVDIEKVKKKAIENGLITQEMLPLMSMDEILLMIFEPGFSTREQVSALSGRGVGMDVVKKATDSIGGNIKVTTEENEGTTIRLKLPASMAVKGTLLCMLEEQTYAIPLSYTEAVVSLYKKDLHKLSNGLVSTYLGRTISIVFLKDLFDLSNGKNLNKKRILQSGFDDLHAEAQLPVVIVSHNGRTIGLVVDKLLQQKEIVEKPLFKPLDNIKILSGVTILGNGKVCPVLNIASINNMIFTATLANQKVY
ncbi:chemotaxis protein CheA [Fulvivirga maritima]|uniref:chemotaxis protein CheA n=1 Tax=Fulvivirga maritima TaxID=2904247 RepID=UPI001F202670|nr:chemotaxis protein CheA [Fulvivirga maritima]UII25290.1 chemotaxis protein CheA [Fulvivirga maritima]